MQDRNTQEWNYFSKTWLSFGTIWVLGSSLYTADLIRTVCESPVASAKHKEASILIILILQNKVVSTMSKQKVKNSSIYKFKFEMDQLKMLKVSTRARVGNKCDDKQYRHSHACGIINHNRDQSLEYTQYQVTSTPKIRSNQYKSMETFLSYC